jgi:hypothetical protein
MRFVGWDNKSGWYEYIANVHNVRRISLTKWEVFYGVPIYNGFRSDSVIVSCDNAWVEVI